MALSNLEIILDKLTGQFVFGEDEGIEIILEYYNQLREITGKLSQERKKAPKVEISRFFYELKTEEQSEKLGKEHSKDYSDNGINLIIVHHAAEDTVPHFSMTGGESKEKFKKCLEINKTFLHYPLGFQKNYPNLAVDVHVMGNHKRKHLSEDFIGNMRKFGEELGLKLYFESRPAGEFPLSYENLPEDLKIHKKAESIFDSGHEATCAIYNARKNKTTQKFEFKKIIRYREEHPITIGVHLNSIVGDTHQVANIGEIMLLKKIIEQEQIEFIIPECFNVSEEDPKKAKLKINIENFASDIFSIAPKFIRKCGYMAYMNIINHNPNTLIGFAKTKENLEKLYSRN